MSRKPVLNKQQIIIEAFEICRNQGLDQLTLRHIAKELGTSTAPIYTQYPNTESLMKDLDAYIEEKLLISTSIKRTPDSFLNIGVGILAFVLDNTLLFNDFYLSKKRLSFVLTEKTPYFLSQMKQNKFISIIGDGRLTILLEDMWVYTYGLATMICTSNEEPKDLAYYEKKLEEVGFRQISYHLYSSGKYEEYLQLIMQKASEYIDLKEAFQQ